LVPPFLIHQLELSPQRQRGIFYTQVSQPSSNTIFHAGSSDWKNSSGWKKVRIVSAFRSRKERMVKKIKEVDEKRKTLGSGLLIDMV